VRVHGVQHASKEIWQVSYPAELGMLPSWGLGCLRMSTLQYASRDEHALLLICMTVTSKNAAALQSGSERAVQAGGRVAESVWCRFNENTALQSERMRLSSTLYRYDASKGHSAR
jgi:hypothetical protein